MYSGWFHISVISVAPFIPLPRPLLQHFPSPPGERRTVYVQLQCSWRISPLYSVLCTKTFCTSHWFLRTVDHITWTPTHYYQGKQPFIKTRPTTRVLLTTCCLLGRLWEVDPEDDIRDINIFIPDQSLVKSFRTSPSTFSNEVANWLHEHVRLKPTPYRRVLYVPTPIDLSFTGLVRAALCMVIAI